MSVDQILSLEQVAARLRDHESPDDDDFDQFLPYALRSVSGQHWTPLEVVQKVVQWISELGIRSVVDLGSGVGKLCVAAALTGQCRFFGIEQRPRLTATARALARRFGVEDRVQFRTGTLGACEIPPADAYYLYNPFGENLLPRADRVDNEVELNEQRFRRDVAVTTNILTQFPVGTYVFEYNGFGGPMPAGYTKVLSDRTLPNSMRVWRKTDVDGRAER